MLSTIRRAVDRLTGRQLDDTVDELDSIIAATSTDATTFQRGDA